MDDLRVNVTMGATLNLGNYESARVEISVAGVDPSGDVAAQLAVSQTTIEQVTAFTIERLRAEALKAVAGHPIRPRPRS